MRSLRSISALCSPRLRPRPAIQQIRHFHPTKPAPFVNEVIELSVGFLNGVHSVTGLPWVASIPISALIVRMTVALPFQMFAKTQRRREQGIAPLLLSYNEYQKKYLIALRDQGGVNLTPAQLQSLMMNDFHKRQRYYSNRYGVAWYYKPLGILQLPIFIAVMEGLRAMSGMQESLFRYWASTFGFSSSTAPQPLDLFEPSLATEGALWFPNLLVGDPTGILPVAVAATMLLNLRYGFKTKTLKEIAQLPPLTMKLHAFYKLLKGVMQGLAIYMAFSTFLVQMPAALLVYWLSSMNIATLQSFIMDRRMSVKTLIMPPKKVYVALHKPGQKQPSTKA